MQPEQSKLNLFSGEETSEENKSPLRVVKPSFEDRKQKIAAELGIVGPDLLARFTEDKDGNILIEGETPDEWKKSRDNLDERDNESYMHGQY